MMSIVAQHYMAVVFHLEVEAPHHAVIACHSPTKLISAGTRQLRQRHGRNAILNIDTNRHSQFHITYVAQWRDIIKHYFASADSHVFSMKVALFATVGKRPHPVLYSRAHLKSCVHYKSSA